MAHRPSTSGDVGPKKTTEYHFRYDKRMSKDDLYLGSNTYVSAGRSRSRRLPPARPFAFEANSREPSPNPRRDARNGEMGGPSSAGRPHSPDTRTQREPPVPMAGPPMPNNSNVDAPDVQLSRKPTGKWKFRNIFGRKQSVPVVPGSDSNDLYSINNKSEKRVGMDEATMPSESGAPGRSNTILSRKNTRRKLINRSQTLPPDTKSEMPRESSRKDGRWEDRMPGHIPIIVDAKIPVSNPGLGSLLNIEIPDVHLERYSVMFNKVLNPSPSLSPRQATVMKKTKSMENVVDKEEKAESRGKAREASPQPSERPPVSGSAISPPRKQGEPYKPPALSSRFRSNTSPAPLILPSETFSSSHPMPSPKHPPATETPSSPHPRHPAYQHAEKPALTVITDAHAMKQAPPPIPQQFTGDKPSVVVDSPTEMEPAVNEAAKGATRRPVGYHLPLGPKRQMTSPPPNIQIPPASPSAEDSYRRRSRSLASPAHSHSTKPSDDLDDASLPNLKMSPVEISIARSISISRQQRKFLRPTQVGRSPSVSPARKPGTIRAAQTDPNVVAEDISNEEPQVIVLKPERSASLLRPQVVPAQHRRSEQVVLEEA
ncbi:hypothetical protein GGR50DRAFT_679174 [Xylaria sp. CBS 124048]|nr:hypothetical protein GGR50DRAFT_679174 [Xylaria sp. CBS 124048]